MTLNKFKTMFFSTWFFHTAALTVDVSRPLSIYRTTYFSLIIAGPCHPCFFASFYVYLILQLLYRGVVVRPALRQSFLLMLCFLQPSLFAHVFFHAVHLPRLLMMIFSFPRFLIYGDVHRHSFSSFFFYYFKLILPTCTPLIVTRYQALYFP